MKPLLEPVNISLGEERDSSPAVTEDVDSFLAEEEEEESLGTALDNANASLVG